MHPSQTDVVSTGALLVEAEARTRRGQYDDALAILARTGYGTSEGHSDQWMGLVCAAAARNKLHAQDDQGALQFLDLIPSDLRAANPKIDAEYHTISGILSRRDAYRKWKKQDKDAALQVIEVSINAFETAERSAKMALEDRLQHNAVLNRLYAAGLRIAIEGQTKERYAALLADAIVAEAASRDSTPPCVRDNLTGLTIIADLARGGAISLMTARSASTAAAYLRAVATIFRGDSASWAGLILGYARDTGPCKSDVLARALLLGANMLYTDRDAVDNDMLTEYAARLRICYLDLEGTSFNKALRQKIAEALAQFPDDIAKKVMHPRFLR